MHHNACSICISLLFWVQDFERQTGISSHSRPAFRLAWPTWLGRQPGRPTRAGRWRSSTASPTPLFCLFDCLRVCDTRVGSRAPLAELRQRLPHLRATLMPFLRLRARPSSPWRVLSRAVTSALVRYCGLRYGSWQTWLSKPQRGRIQMEREKGEGETASGRVRMRGKVSERNRV